MAKRLRPGMTVLSVEDLRPDENGLLIVQQVAGIAWRRACTAVYRSEIAVEIVGPEFRIVGDRKTAVVTAADLGRWSLISVLAACREATGQPSYRIPPTAKIRNPGGLDELKIARIIAADGVRPYLARPSQYLTNNRNHLMRPIDPRLRAQAIGVPEDMNRAVAGERTWLMLKLMAIPYHSHIAAKTTYDFRRCVGLLNDVGLLETQLGKKGGLGTAIHTWTPSAYLPAPAPVLETVDEEALHGFAM
jgi:hypothetical protein